MEDVLESEDEDSEAVDSEAVDSEAVETPGNEKQSPSQQEEMENAIAEEGKLPGQTPTEIQEIKTNAEKVKIVVSLDIEDEVNVRDSSQFLLLSGPLATELEDATGLKTVIVDKPQLGSL